jgi:hypothetical protein
MAWIEQRRRADGGVTADCRAAGLPAGDADHPRDDQQKLGQSPAHRAPANSVKRSPGQMPVDEERSLR